MTVVVDGNFLVVFVLCETAVYWNLFIRWFLIQDGLNVDQKNTVFKQKCIDYIEK